METKVITASEMSNVDKEVEQLVNDINTQLLKLPKGKNQYVIEFNSTNYGENVLNKIEELYQKEGGWDATIPVSNNKIILRIK